MCTSVPFHVQVCTCAHVLSSAAWPPCQPCPFSCAYGTLHAPMTSSAAYSALRSHCTSVVVRLSTHRAAHTNVLFVNYDRLNLLIQTKHLHTQLHTHTQHTHTAQAHQAGPGDVGHALQDSAHALHGAYQCGRVMRAAPQTVSCAPARASARRRAVPAGWGGGCELGRCGCGAVVRGGCAAAAAGCAAWGEAGARE